jgi:hypothetical protein
MRKPTDKLLVALELLERALSMYYTGDSYFAALHLAGGAEEIFRGYVKRSGGEASFESIREGAVRISQFLGDRAGSNPKDVAKIMNYARNRTKHIDDNGDDDVRFDPPTEAFDMLSRAVSDYYTLMEHFELEETQLISRFNSERA